MESLLLVKSNQKQIILLISSGLNPGMSMLRRYMGFSSARDACGRARGSIDWLKVRPTSWYRLLNVRSISRMSDRKDGSKDPNPRPNTPLAYKSKNHYCFMLCLCYHEYSRFYLRLIQFEIGAGQSPQSVTHNKGRHFCYRRHRKNEWRQNASARLFIDMTTSVRWKLPLIVRHANNFAEIEIGKRFLCFHEWITLLV